METPSSTMFADLKNFGRISNRDAAYLLLSPTTLYGGAPVRDRVNDRTFLSREVVHAKPQGIPAERFGDIAQATLTIAHRIIDTLDGDGQALLLQHYGGPAARQMCATLDACGLDSKLYGNALAKLSQAQLSSERDRGTLYLMLFVATGCLGNPWRSVGIVEDYAASKLAAGLYTTETSVGPGFADDARSLPEQTALGLLRIAGGVAKPPIHPLSTSPEGTIVGVLAPGPSDITDVDRDVSRRHVHIWRSDGRWYVQGLGSTNGTTLISGDTRETHVVEPPRSQRTPGATYPPRELLNSDTLCLGATTQFLVMRIAE